MAQFDLKNADITIEDGYGGSGTVGTAGALINATTVPVLFSPAKILAVGDRLQFNSLPAIYTVTAHTETSSSTTSVVITPGLGAAVVSTNPVTVLPHSITVKVGEGNMTYAEKKNRQYTKDRGRLDTVRNGDQEPVDVRLDFQWEFIMGDTGDPPTVEDAFKNRNGAAGWLTSSADPCEPYSVNLIILYTPLCSGVKKEKIVLEDFRYEDLSHDLKAGQVAVTGKCNVTEAVVTRIS